MPFPPTHPSLLRAITERGYTEPTAVQAAVLGAEGVPDLLVSARTGSGKTVAFGLALAATLLGDAERFESVGSPRALVIAPTRELAMQVQRELAWLFAPTGARVVSCVGGMDVRREAMVLERGVHIVVGTPGRLCDHLDRKRLDLSRLAAVVLDEADEMLDMGFREELEHILAAAPAERRTLMFSATIPDGIVSLTRKFQKDAVRIDAGEGHEPHPDIQWRAVTVHPREREHAIVNILRMVEAPGALVFCATREGVNHLHANLVERGFLAVALSGELGQSERNRALQALRDGRARVCVATDVAARGLDLPDLGLVIHADLPHDAQGLLHRSGRTGRAGRKGIAVLLVPANRRRTADFLIRAAGLSPTWSVPPTADAILEKDRERLTVEIAGLAIDASEEDLELARVLIAGSGAEALVAALVRAQRARMPAPEEVTVPPPLRREPVHRELPMRSPREERPMREAPRQMREDPRPAREESRPVREESRPMREDPRPMREGPRPMREESRERFQRPDPTDRHEQTEARPSRHSAGLPNPEVPDGRPSSGRSRGAMVWFRVNAGRNMDADPRWLVPLICRRGNIEKADIGSIRVLDVETHFEVSDDLAERFFLSSGRPDRREPQFRFAVVRDEGPRNAPQAGQAGSRGGGPMDTRGGSGQYPPKGPPPKWAKNRRPEDLSGSAPSQAAKPANFPPPVRDTGGKSIPKRPSREDRGGGHGPRPEGGAQQAGAPRDARQSPAATLPTVPPPRPPREPKRAGGPRETEGGPPMIDRPRSKKRAPTGADAGSTGPKRHK